jgi:hypothetical protein
MFGRANRVNLAASQRVEEVMYSALFRALPGNKILKSLQIVALAGIGVLILFTLVFPVIESFMAEDPLINGN